MSILLCAFIAVNNGSIKNLQPCMYPLFFFLDLYDDYVLHNEPNFYAGAHASVAQAAGVASSRVSMLRVRFSFVFVFKRRRNCKTNKEANKKQANNQITNEPNRFESTRQNARLFLVYI